MPTNRKKNPHQKKSMGQVFLINPWPCEMVAEKLSSQGISHVLEIGPGKGALTSELLKENLQVTAIEKDPYWFEWLNTHLKSEQLHTVCEDILQYDISKWIQQHRGKNLAIVGNIPYHISTAILAKTIPWVAQGVPAWFLVQLEYAQRLVAIPRTKAYGSLSVYTQLRTEAEMLVTVPRTDFRPVPKVDSAIICLTKPKKEYSEDILTKVEVFTRHAFSQRRKKLRNSLKPFLSSDDEELCPVDLGRRCDELTPEEFIHLTEYLRSEKLISS